MGLPHVSPAQTSSCQVLCLIYPVLLILLRCRVRLRVILLHGKVRWKKVFDVFLGWEVRNRSHTTSQLFTDHQVPANKPKKILHMEECQQHLTKLIPNSSVTAACVVPGTLSWGKSMLSFEVAFLQWVRKLSLQLLVGFTSFASSLSYQSYITTPESPDGAPQSSRKQSIGYIYYFLLDPS